MVSSTKIDKEDIIRSRSDFNSTQQLSKSKPLDGAAAENMEEVKEEGRSRVSKLFSQFNSKIAKGKSGTDTKWKRMIIKEEGKQIAILHSIIINQLKHLNL